MKILRFYHMKYIWLTGFILWTLFITVLSVMPYSREFIEQNSRILKWDSLQHFLAYFAMGTFYIMWRGDRSYSIKWGELAVIFAVACSFSFFTEYVQLIIPGRNFNIIDMIYNLAGVLGSILIVYFYLVRYYLRKKQLSVQVFK